MPTEAVLNQLSSRKVTESLMMQIILHCAPVLFVLLYTKNVQDANYNVPVFSAFIVIANAGFCLESKGAWMGV